ncbi:proteoglycan 4-like protein [Labeo rohita]|uniref:Proteoglycan 4-like protein n=1 Tax=Labeo rohita TaxID=84645 RepID=A0A498L287_LABRO|nr:proteoglycan 4-like protein [Labeo rohita]
MSEPSPEPALATQESMPESSPVPVLTAQKGTSESSPMFVPEALESASKSVTESVLVSPESVSQGCPLSACAALAPEFVPRSFVSQELATKAIPKTPPIRDRTNQPTRDPAMSIRIVPPQYRQGETGTPTGSGIAPPAGPGGGIICPVLLDHGKGFGVPG